MARTAQETVGRVLLGREIAYVRTGLSMSQSQLGKAIGKGQDMITLLEAGRATVTREQLDTLLEVLEISDDDHRTSILSMHKDSHRHGDWSTGYRRAYSEHLRLLIDLEQHASQIFITQVEIIPGLLQCGPYTTSLTDARRLSKGVTTKDVVQAWQARQSILLKDDAPEVHVVLSESALRRRYAPNAVMRQQMEHLEELSNRHGVLLQVLPFDSLPEEAFVARPYSYQLLQVPTRGRAGALRIVYDEGLSEIRYRGDPDAVDVHDRTKVSLAAAALSADDSRQFLRYIAGTFL